MPSPLFEVQWMNQRLERQWGSVGAKRLYTDSTGRVTEAALSQEALAERALLSRNAISDL